MIKGRDDAIDELVKLIDDSKDPDKFLLSGEVDLVRFRAKAEEIFDEYTDMIEYGSGGKGFGA